MKSDSSTFLRVLVMMLVAHWADTADFTKSVCFDGKDTTEKGTVTLTCPKEHVIIVEEAVFGFHKWGGCIITVDDCTEKTRIFQECDGLANCTRTFKTYTKTCGYSTMLVLGYSCIKTAYINPATPQPADVDEIPPDDYGNDMLDGSQQPYPTSGGKTSIPKPAAIPTPSEDSGKSTEETGLIVGCALASLLVVVVLLVAIVMVARRLMQPMTEDKGDNSSFSNCCGPLCVKINCFPCTSKSLRSNQEKPHDLRMRKKAAQESSQHPEQSSNPKLRMAPVGEENDNNQSPSAPQDSLEVPKRVSEKNARNFRDLADLGRLNPGKPPREKEIDRSLEGHVYHDFPEFDKRCIINENTLPSSSNLNLRSQCDRIESEETLDSMNAAEARSSASSEEGSSRCFDAVAIPNTLIGSAC